MGQIALKAVARTRSSEVLPLGVISFDEVTGVYKIGDGVSILSDLPEHGNIDADVTAAIATLVGNAPEALDKLNELADALGDDPNFATTILADLAGKEDVGNSVPLSTATTKGDIFIASAASTVTRLGAGSKGQVLTPDSAQSKGVKWAFLSALGHAVNVKDYGAIGDGTADDTAAIVAAVAACPGGGTVFFPAGHYKITSAITVPGSISLQGSNQYDTFIVAIACGAIVLASSSNDDFAIRNLGIYLAVRYTTTVNNLIGIEVQGDTVNRPFNHIYEDVYVDGFKTAFKSSYLWASKFDNFRCNNGLIGIDAYGSSVNNEVSKCAISVSSTTNSRGIRFNGDVPSEGWIIGDTIIDGADIGIHGTANVHIYIHDTIIDHCLTYGILVEDNTVNFGGAWNIHDCYIAMTGAAGVAAIRDTNSVVNAQNVGHRIHHNTILAYAGATCLRGVYLSGAATTKALVDSNTVNNFTTADLEAVVGNGCKAFGNVCLSAITNNVIGFDGVSHNTGVISGTNIRLNAPARRLIATFDPAKAVATTAIGANNRGCYYQMKDGGAITKVGYEVVNSVGNICIAHFANSGVGRNSVPGARIATTGSFACPASGYRETALATTIQPGDWLFISGDTAAVSFKALANFASVSDLYKGASGLEGSAHPAPVNAGMIPALIGPICLIGVP